MIASTLAQPVRLRRFPLLALLLAVALPLGAVHAEDGKASRAKDGKAKIDAKDGKAKIDAYHKEVWAKIQALVAAGKMTKEAAIAKMAVIKKEAYSKTKGGKKSEAGKKTAPTKKTQTVKKTKPGAKTKVDNKTKPGLKTKADNKTKPDPKTKPAPKTKPVGKPKAGDKTKADKKTKPGQKKPAGDKTKPSKKSPKGSVEAHLEIIWKGLQGVVAAGGMSQKDAEAVISAIKMKVYSEKKKKVYDEKKKGNDKTASDTYFPKVWAELQAAVAAGKISKEDATAKMNAIKKAKSGL